jgi:outer membrane protein
MMTFSLSWIASAQVSQNLLSDSQPVYEAGAGFIILNLPDYPGSNNMRVRVIPFPYYIYRGKYLRADDEGTRARFFSSKRHETGLSFGVNFPSNSGDNPSRLGMPDLDALFSIGPRLLFRFLTDSPNHKLNLSLATRAVFSSKLSFNNLLRDEGFLIEPRLNYWYRWEKYDSTFFTSFGLEFGSAKYNQFFYNVDPAFQTPTRAPYLAKAGLVEKVLTIGFGTDINEDIFIFSGASFRNLDWAANKNSPLIETRNNVGFTLGLIWTFIESDEMVQREELSEML